MRTDDRAVSASEPGGGWDGWFDHSHPSRREPLKWVKIMDEISCRDWLLTLRITELKMRKGGFAVIAVFMDFRQSCFQSCIPGNINQTDAWLK